MPSKNTYKGTIPSPTIKKGTKGDKVKQLQNFLNWYGNYKLVPDGIDGTKTTEALKAFQKAEKLTVDGIYGSKSYNAAKAYKYVTNAQKLCDKMKELSWAYGTAKSKYAYKGGAPKASCKKAMAKYGWTSREKMSSCVYFANTVVRESGVNKSFKANGNGMSKPYPKVEDGFSLVLYGKKIPDGFLKAGDFIRYKKTNNDQHAMFYYGDGKVCDAGHYNRFANIRKDEKRYNKDYVIKSTLQVFRPKE